MKAHESTNLRAMRLFVAYLGEMPLAEWIAATIHARRSPRLAAAHASLDALVRRATDHQDVFATMSAVLDALHRFECPEGRHLTRMRHSTDNLRPDTERAALAVLLHDHLATDHFALLYEPFEPRIPAVLLFGVDDIARPGETDVL